MKRISYLLLTALLLSCLVSCKADQLPKPYYLFVYNSKSMTEEDFSAIESLDDLYPDYSLVKVDTHGLKTAKDVYNRLKQERDARGCDPEGIQIFGTPSAVPAFVHKHEFEMQTQEEMYREDDFVSDYFYTNFNNDPDALDQISAHELAHSLDEIDIMPAWHVVRLPLLRGDFADFITKYREYLALIEEQNIVNVSVASPILPVGWYSVALDDTGHFLTRARDEWKFIDNVHLYGTTEGFFASTLDLEGSCNADDWAPQTKQNVCEIFHESHANKDVLSQTIFTGRGKYDYYCTDVLTTNTINRKLNGMPYFLNTGGCQPAKDMSGNIITKALSGRCVGAIASTAVLHGIDIDCMLSGEEYVQGYCKYSLLYGYLKAKSEGATRAEAFCAGQRQMALAFIQNADTTDVQSYQSNLNNLLAFQNFGLIDP